MKSGRFGLDGFDESTSDITTFQVSEVFPEPRSERTDLLAGTPWTGQRMNVFFPWMINQDGSETETISTSGTIYPIRYMQFFQGDLLRGIYGLGSPGRRVLARELHDSIFDNPPTTGAAGSVRLGWDGSMAAIVPASRAMAWQLTAPDDEPVVRERVWLTFKAGEVRVCASCHGLNTADQIDDPLPLNEPVALGLTLDYWSRPLCQIDDDTACTAADLASILRPSADPLDRPSGNPDANRDGTLDGADMVEITGILFG